MENYKNPISLFKQTNFSKTIWWKLKVNISGYQNEKEDKLVTEIFKNRIFRLLYPNIYQYNQKFSRILVQLYEDGYVCWISLDGLIIEEYELKKTENLKNEQFFIQDKVISILKWIKDQADLTNEYLWGGTLGPNYDCSGLIQTAFLKHNIQIPRDSYQIKSFCKHLFYFKESYAVLQPGDLLFFGNKEKCDHIGIYKEDGLYYHCSGKDFGRNGIGLDTLKQTNDKISLHFKTKLISAGRVVRNYRWDRTIR
ncbi:MAG: C40 family peptidase [Prochlorococcus marinus XMU1428]|nr:C40 family peptidase [Prochlorococcus marinus XMU1428]